MMKREGVPRMALRVVRPRCPHTEDKARNIERRDPCGHAAEWLLRQQCKRYKKREP